MPSSDADPTTGHGAHPQLTLGEYEELCGLLTEHTFDFIRLHDLEGRSIYASRSVERLYRRAPATLFEFAHPDDAEAGRRWWQQILAGGTERLRWRVLDAEGAWRWLETAASLVQFQRKPHVLTVCRDVSEYVKAEQQASESREHLSLVISTLPVGVAVLNRAGDVVLANPASKRIWGEVIASGEARWGRSIGRWRDSGRRIEPSEWASARAISLGQTSLNELIDIETLDGQAKTIENSAAPLRDVEGRIVGAVAINQDVTARMRAEEARGAAERRLEHVVSSSPAILFTLQIEQERFLGIEWMSENVETLLGYSVQETLGPDWWMSNVHAEDRDAVVGRFLSDILSHDHAAAEYRFRHKNGQFRWLRGETRLLRDAAGGPADVIGSLSDITERKRLEDQFRQAQKMEAIGHLAGGVAHDFNNLLTVVTGYTDLLLLDGALTESHRGMIAEIKHAAERASGLTRQLLAFSRRTVLEPRTLDLNALVREHENMLGRLIGEDVQLRTNLDPRIEPVRVDPGQVGQVIVNLAVNARDAMPTGGKLTIETRSVTLDDTAAAAIADATPGRYVLLAITDAGVGMTADVRARIFEPFFTTKGPGKGTGLGLATVYGIVKQSGGFVVVDSEPDRGSRFGLYFPALPKSASVPATMSAGNLLAGGAETILLVEDEDAVRRTIRAALRRAGYTVLEARGGPQALRIAVGDAASIDLVITDVIMPVMSGPELVERLARQRPGLKVLYLSGYTDDAVVRHGVLQAEVSFLQKPFNMTALATKVRQILDESPA
jgi:two-component system, cell cycle sensor histidine kinase and response regulator CckA